MMNSNKSIALNELMSKLNDTKVIISKLSSNINKLGLNHAISNKYITFYGDISDENFIYLKGYLTSLLDHS